MIKSKRANGEGKVIDHYDYTDGGTKDEPVTVLFTGPIAGTIVLADGTVYDITPDQVLVRTPEHLGQLHHHIWRMHKESGRFVVDGVTQMNHECSDSCGPLPAAE